MEFDGTVVLVTGATSGIGAAIARAFSARGATVVLTGRDAARGEAVRAALGGAPARFVAGDIREAGFADRLVDETVAFGGRLDVLVNNAGIIHYAAVDETTDAQWRETMAVNVDGVFRASRAAVRVMKRQGGGNIVNIASDWGLRGGARALAYCASKGAVVQMTRAMAIDHARDGIRVNAVCPGDVDTPMLDDEARQLGIAPDAARRRSAAAIPLGRIAAPDDVAHAVLFLASDAARHVTGAALPVDGGGLAG